MCLNQAKQLERIFANQLTPQQSPEMGNLGNAVFGDQKSGLLGAPCRDI